MSRQNTYLDKPLQTCLVLFLAAYWLVQDTYTGLHLDSILYSFLALFHQMPENFQNDIFMKYGGQGNYTLFPALYAYFVSALGLQAAAFALTLVAKVAWFAGLVRLAQRLAGAYWIACLAGVVLVSPFYDGFTVFLYADSNLTPRIFAEALCLFSLRALWDRHYGIASLLICFAGALHPLMAAVGGLLLSLTLITDTAFSVRIRLSIAFGGAVAVTALLLSVVGHDAMATRLDEHWVNIISLTSNTYQLPDKWNFDMGCKPLYFMLILGLTHYLHLADVKRVMWCLVASVLLLLGIWIIGSGVLRNAFITQLQPWRGLWLLQIVSIILNVRLLLALWQGSVPQRWAAALLTLAFCNIGFLGLHVTPSAALFLAISACVLWALLSRIPSKYFETCTMRLLPWAVIAPQCVAYLQSVVELWILVVPILFYALIRCTSARGVITAACALLAVGLAPLVGETMMPLSSMICFLIWMTATDHNHPLWVRFPVKACLLVALGVLCAQGIPEFLALFEKELKESISPALGDSMLTAEIMVLAACGVAFFWIRHKWRPPYDQVLLPLLGFATFAGAFTFWLPTQAQLPTYNQPWADALQSRIPKDAVVLSDRGVDWSWFVLHRSFYESHLQLFGPVFSRRTAIEGYRRRLFLCEIDSDFCLHTTSAFGRDGTHVLTDSDIGKICSDPALDFLVLRGRYRDSIEVVADSSGQPNSLIACAPLRSTDQLSKNP
jgi:hypothetical protein